MGRLVVVAPLRVVGAVSAGVQGVEPVIAALKARLDTYLPAEVAQANADAADAYVLSDAVVFDYLPTPSGEMGQFPIVGIAEDRSRFEDDTGWSATSVWLVRVVVWEQDADQRALAFKLRRWERCLLRVALKNRRLTDPRSAAGWGIVLDGTEAGPSFELEDPRVYVSWRSITATIRSEEE